MVFALFALQVYMGELRNKCVKVVTGNLSHFEWLKFATDEENWLFDEEAKNPVMCGNTTEARRGFSYSTY